LRRPIETTRLSGNIARQLASGRFADFSATWLIPSLILAAPQFPDGTFESFRPGWGHDWDGFRVVALQSHRLEISLAKGDYSDIPNRGQLRLPRMTISRFPAKLRGLALGPSRLEWIVRASIPALAMGVGVWSSSDGSSVGSGICLNSSLPDQMPILIVCDDFGNNSSIEVFSYQVMVGK
jgi:hypothetical protein